MKILTLIYLLSLSCLAQDIGQFTFSWNTNKLKGVKEYRIYAAEGIQQTNKFKIIGITTNNWITISNLINLDYIFYATAIGINEIESLPSRKVKYPRDIPESPVAFDYKYNIISNDKKKSVSTFEHKDIIEPPVTEIIPK